MNKEESEDIESAYASEIPSYSNVLISKDTFTIDDSLLKSGSRCQWLKHKLRESMILEVVVFLILIFLLITCYRITSQNEETQKMVLIIQSQLHSFQKQAAGEDLMKKKQDTKEMIQTEYEKMETISDEIMREGKFEPAVQLVPSIINTNSEKVNSPPIFLTVSTNSTLRQFNAASFIAGATIDVSLSSNSNFNSILKFDQSSLVLVDRSEPPSSKAWCTYEMNPVLTVNLAKYIKPTAVSYQHSKWIGKIPDNAPKEYSVEACLDHNCKHVVPLFSNCEYNSNGHQEKFCKITNHSINAPVIKLQFRFHKNHGNTERTCVSLVRVYSETEVVGERKLRPLEDKATCLDLKNDYDNNPFTYNYYRSKNCTVLYTKGCCQECPECCEECEPEDINDEVISNIIVGMIILIPLTIIFCWGLISLLNKIFMFFEPYDFCRVTI